MPDKLSEKLSEMKKLKEEQETALWGTGLQRMRAEMALNRREMASTIEEIKRRIPPGASVGDIARQRIREGIAERAGSLVKYEDRFLIDMLRHENELVSGLRRAAEGVILKHPVLSGLAALGLAWLFSEFLSVPRSARK